MSVKVKIDPVMGGAREDDANEQGGGTADLPIASTSQVGVVKVGTGLKIDANGKLEAKIGGALYLSSAGAVVTKWRPHELTSTDPSQSLNDGEACFFVKRQDDSGALYFKFQGYTYKIAATRL